MKALIAFLLLIVVFVVGARVRVRDSWWKLLAFIAACVVVLGLLLAIIAE